MRHRMYPVFLAAVLTVGTSLVQTSLPSQRARAASAAVLSVTPQSASPGTSLSVTGSNLGSRLTGSLDFDGSMVATFVTNSHGKFSLSWTLPSQTAPGTHTLTATTSAATSSAPVTVLAAPTATPTATSVPIATATPMPTASPTPSSTVIPTGMLEPGGSLFVQEGQAGLQLASIELSWSQAEPSNSSYSSTYFQQIENEIAAARAAGLAPVLSLGIHYTPSWVFNLDPASRFVDQYGDAWTASTGSGNGVANFVFSSTLRSAEAAYIQHVFSVLGTNFAAVRWGGGLPYDEVAYPACPSGRSNCYWAFDANALASSPVPNYAPGQGDPSQAQTFLNYYLSSLQTYVAWGLGIIRQSYQGEIDVLFGSWGIRPGDVTAALAANLNGTTVRSSEIAAGRDWQNQLPAFAQSGNVVAWSTWLNRQDDYTDVASWSPIHYLASLAPTGMGLGGENTYGKATTTDLSDTFNNARVYHLRRVLWMNESLTQQTGNASILQVGQTATG